MSSVSVNYDPFNIGASYDDAVRTLTLPVSERAGPRQIQVGRSDEGQPRIGREPA